MSAGVFSARGIAELDQQVIALSNDGYRIITVFETHEEFYHVVAQKDPVKEELLISGDEKYMVDIETSIRRAYESRDLG